MINQETTLASEMLSELKRQNRRLFIALLVALAIIGDFIVYLSLPIEEVTVSQEVDGEANQLIGLGDYYGGETNSDVSQETLAP